MSKSIILTRQGESITVYFDDGSRSLEITSLNNGPAIIRLLVDGRTASPPFMVDQTHDEVLRLQELARRFQP